MEQPKRADDGLAFLLQYENVAWYENGAVRILDRRCYPMRTEYVTCRTHREVAQAIADMVTQSGGPYAAAAMGMALAAFEARGKPEQEQLRFLTEAARTLSTARPTTSARMAQCAGRCLEAAKAALAAGRSAEEACFLQALADMNSRYGRYDKVGRYLAAKIPRNGTVMTQCFGETVVGTFLRACREAGSAVKVICPETRPYFQGARLTASCACDMGFDVTVITDNMPGYVMKRRGVDVFTSAADVITLDGHIVNKVGTFQIALAASYWGIPYYVTGTPSREHPTMDSVVIEEREPAGTLEALGTRTVLDGVHGYYPAFDVTPPKLCDGVVTDQGIFAPTDLSSYRHAAENSSR